VPGERDDGLQPRAPRRHTSPSPVCVGELAGRRRGDQISERVVSGHAANLRKKPMSVRDGGGR
jgi:hypothetical protein